jgi:hypothetical protein
VCERQQTVIVKIAGFVSLLLLSATLIGQAAKSGITGVVIQIGHGGPTRVGEPPHYYQGPMEVIRASDKSQVAAASSDKDGRFTVDVPPGTYRIVHNDPTHSRIGSPDIVVEKGKFTAVQIYADNGMR